MHFVPGRPRQAAIPSFSILGTGTDFLEYGAMVVRNQPASGSALTGIQVTVSLT